MKNRSKSCLQYTKSSPNTQKVLKLIRRKRRKYLSAYRENAKRILPYSPNKPRDIKLSLSRRIFYQNQKYFSSSDRNAERIRRINYELVDYFLVRAASPFTLRKFGTQINLRAISTGRSCLIRIVYC
jgi:hypothetical protein